MRGVGIEAEVAVQQVRDGVVIELTAAEPALEFVRTEGLSDVRVNATAAVASR